MTSFCSFIYALAALLSGTNAARRGRVGRRLSRRLAGKATVFLLLIPA